MIRVQHRDPNFTGPVAVGGRTAHFTDGVALVERGAAGFRRLGHTVHPIVTGGPIESPDSTDSIPVWIDPAHETILTKDQVEQWATEDEQNRVDGH